MRKILGAAAPGVEILAPAPEETYQMSCGQNIGLRLLSLRSRI
jgi:hypothetical protein